MRNATRLKRLRQLSHMLKNHKKIFKTVKFDITTWTRTWTCGGTDCNTAACALGSAAIYPPFMKSGLKLWKGIPYYKRSRRYAAGMEFFGILEKDARYVFDPHEYHTRPRAATVAKRVDTLIKKYRKAA